MNSTLKRFSLAAALAALAVFAPSVSAEPRTVTLSVPGMFCPACETPVKKALSKVDGVGKVEVSYQKKQAVVTFDDAKTTVEALSKATEKAGFPSALKR